MTRKTDNLVLKTLAFLLAVITITAAVAGGAASFVLGVSAAGQNSWEEEDIQKNFLDGTVYEDLQTILGIYTQEQRGDIPIMEYNIARMNRAYYEREGELYDYPGCYTGDSNLRYEIFDSVGNKVKGNYQGEKVMLTRAWEGSVVYLTKRTIPAEYLPQDGLWDAEETFTDYSQATTPTESGTEAEIPEEYRVPNSYRSATVNDDGSVTYTYWEDSEEYTAVGYVLEDLPYPSDSYAQTGRFIHLLYANKGDFLTAFIVGLVLTILLSVYLFSAAGRRANEPGIHCNFMDKLPLDLYAMLVGIGAFAVVAMLFYIGDGVFYPLVYSTSSYNITYLNGMNMDYILWGLGLLIALGAAMLLGFFLSLATRIKLGGGYWWRRSVAGWCLRKIWHFLRWCWQGVLALLQMMPIIWRWLALSFALWLVLLISMINFHWDGFAQMMFFLASMAIAGVVCFVAWSVGNLRRNTKCMASGELSQVDNRHMHGIFKDISADLSALSRGAEIAVAEKMKSERLKTELITNVSHDIKTPLTSIVNYVDLLQKPHTPEEEKEYLSVLDRQSKRMKKLTEDLVEMSKAATGNIPAYLTPTDLVELANQALGEYEDKLEKAGLFAELSLMGRNGQRLGPDARIMVMADGRLLWRVLDNLLGNVVKYAQPGTRVYLDIADYGKKVMLSVKNISRDRLNISADKLMERFVQGDASRNTEGSGLGLNIARSLTDLQNAQLNLVVDGDLFKAILLYDAIRDENGPAGEEKN